MPVVKEREYRTIPAVLSTGTENRQRIESNCYVEGYAAIFDEPYVLYEMDGVKYYERIAKTAFAEADMSDVIMQYNHDGKVLARQSNGTLGVECDTRGLFMYADLSKSRAAQEMFEEIKSGLVNKMSWAFTVAADEYDIETNTRTITRIKKVYDVSAVSYPANPDTEISARTYIDGVIERRKKLEELSRRKRIVMIKIAANAGGKKNEH